MSRVLVGGGTGFIGRHIMMLLKENGFAVTCVSRTAGAAANNMTWNDVDRVGLPEDCTAVINVAGASILDPFKKWDMKYKEEVWNSRVETTQQLARAIEMAEHKPKCFVTMSGVGYYEPSATAEYTEDSPGGDFDFLSKLCTEWEEAGNTPESPEVRRVIVRSGVVLGRDGGMIRQIYWPWLLGVGGRMGSGKQFFPWIHILDIASIFVHAVKHDDVTGVLNGVSPEIVTNKDFTRTFSRAIWVPAILPMTTLHVNWMFGPDRGKMLLEGQKVIPKRTLESGYEFAFPDLKSACKDCATLMATSAVTH